MSEELTRFPIQPDDRRRSAKSSENIKAVPEEMPDEDPEDKPSVPPHQRHEDPEQPDDDEQGDAG